MTVSAVDNAPLNSMLRGLRSQLGLAFPAAKFELGIMPSKVTETSWKQTVKRTPFVGIGWNSVTNKTGKVFSGVTHWSVFLVVSNTNSELNRLMGDAQGPGLFQMVTAATVALNGFQIPDLRSNAPQGGTVGTCTVALAQNAGAEWATDNLAFAILDLEVLGTEMSVASCLQGVEATPDALDQISDSWVFTGFGAGAQLSDLNTIQPFPGASP